MRKVPLVPGLAVVATRVVVPLLPMKVPVWKVPPLRKKEAAMLVLETLVMLVLLVRLMPEGGASELKMVMLGLRPPTKLMDLAPTALNVPGMLALALLRLATLVPLIAKTLTRVPGLVPEMSRTNTGLPPSVLLER